MDWVDRVRMGICILVVGFLFFIVGSLVGSFTCFEEIDNQLVVEYKDGLYLVGDKVETVKGKTLVRVGK